MMVVSVVLGRSIWVGSRPSQQPASLPVAVFDVKRRSQTAASYLFIDGNVACKRDDAAVGY